MVIGQIFGFEIYQAFEFLVMRDRLLGNDHR